MQPVSVQCAIPAYAWSQSLYLPLPGTMGGDYIQHCVPHRVQVHTTELFNKHRIMQERETCIQFGKATSRCSECHFYGLRVYHFLCLALYSAHHNTVFLTHRVHTIELFTIHHIRQELIETSIQ